MKTIISTKNLCFQNFLHYPDLCIMENTITFISGVSGIGKSTLLKLFNANLSPSNGQIMYLGENIDTLDKVALRREMLLTKQVPYLFNGSVYDNFKAFHQFHESDCPSEDEMARYLAICCIPTCLDTRCETMSGGERQRVFLSIALSLTPKVLLLDEPTSALNKQLSLCVLENIVQYVQAQAITLIVISHDECLQDAFAQNVIELRRT